MSLLPQTIWLCVVAVLSFVLVCVCFACTPDRFAVVTPAYTLVPRDAGCAAWVDNECVETYAIQTPSEVYHQLMGVMPLAEHRALGLFSETNVLVVSLTAQILLAVYSLIGWSNNTAIITTNDVTENKEEGGEEEEGLTGQLQVRWLFRKAGFAVLFAYALLLFFMQTIWRIPQNNLLWLEGLLFGSLLVLGSSHHSRYLGSGQTDPLRPLGKNPYEDALRTAPARRYSTRYYPTSASHY